MSAQPHLQAVPEIDQSIRRRRLIRAAFPTSLVLAELRAEADRRHRTLVQLEALLKETPIWCLGQRRAIARAVRSCQPTMWSW